MPPTQWASDLLVSMRRGDITQVSVQFYITQHSWRMIDSVHTRIVECARLIAVSIMAFGELGQANADTEEQIASARKLGRMEGQLAATSSTTVQ